MSKANVAKSMLWGDIPALVTSRVRHVQARDMRTRRPVIEYLRYLEVVARAECGCRETVQVIASGRRVLGDMVAPMAGMMQQMGIKEADRAQVIVQEAVLPLLTAHNDELLDIQVQSFAGVLNKEDLQAVSTFYSSPAGRRLAAAQPQLVQAQMAGTTQWMQGIMPEMQTKIVPIIKAKGWGPGDKPK